MAFAEFDKTREIQLTTVGRTSGRESSRTVWFVRDGETLYLLPVYGSSSQWYKDVLEAPVVHLTAHRTKKSGQASPITDPARVAAVVGRFSAKYGAPNIDAYYPKRDVAVEIHQIAK
jgi:hypothetical protein